jgi:hypothetical protein
LFYPNLEGLSWLRLERIDEDGGFHKSLVAKEFGVKDGEELFTMIRTRARATPVSGHLSGPQTDRMVTNLDDARYCGDVTRIT